MTKQKNKLLFLLFGLILMFLYLMSSTNLIIHEKKREIYSISVIAKDSSDGAYEKLRKGMDQAAEEFHVDLSFLTLFESNDQAQQISLIAREIGDGARAVILMPANPEEAGISLEDMVLNSPLIMLGSLVPNQQVMVGISIDCQKAGRLLGQAVREDESKGPIFLITEGLEYGYAREIYDGLMQELSGTDRPIQVVVIKSEADFKKQMAEEAFGSQGVIVALDETSLDIAARLIGDGEEVPYKGWLAPALYGIGGTTRILNDLDKGIIRGLVVHNWFDEGYLCIEKAVDVIQGVTGEKEQLYLDVYYITREDLRNPVYEKMLYPIE